MRKIIFQQQNKSKALEVRLENTAPDKYSVIIAGLTMQNYNPCQRGVCEPTSEGEYLFVENETYCTYEYKSLVEAKTIYDCYTAKYLTL